MSNSEPSSHSTYSICACPDQKSGGVSSISVKDPKHYMNCGTGGRTTNGYFVRVVERAVKHGYTPRQDRIFYNEQKHRDAPEVKVGSIVCYEIGEPIFCLCPGDIMVRHRELDDEPCCHVCLSAFLFPFQLAACVVVFPFKCLCLPCIYAHAQDVANVANNESNQKNLFFLKNAIKLGYTKDEATYSCCYGLFNSKCKSYNETLFNGYLLQGIDDIVVYSRGSSPILMHSIVGQNKCFTLGAPYSMK